MPEDAQFDPSKDPLLRGIPIHDGYCLLPPCAIRGAIGRGGMGVVYRGRHVDFDIDVAVKCLDPALAEQNKNFVERFQQEAQAAAQINHQNVVRVFTIGEAHGLYYLVMEYVEGETANQRVVRKGPLHVTEAVQIALGASRGLAAAHEAGLIHRDVKPDNILISPKGAIKLADLGLAKSAAAEGGMTQTGTMLGTPRYMPLEQWQSAKGVGPATDVYAMGAVLWFLLVGRDAIEGNAPFEVLQRVSNEDFPDLAEARPDVPSDVVEVVRRCTQKAPEDRYSDASELVAALESIVLVEKTMLADENCGSQVIAKTLISPPPPKTLTEIRVRFGGTPAEPVEKTPRKRAVSVPKWVAIGSLLTLAIGNLIWLGLNPDDGNEPKGDSTSEVTPSEPESKLPAAEFTRSQPTSAQPVSDSRAPQLLVASPKSGSFLLTDQPTIRLEFDELLREASIAGQSLKISGSVASGRLHLKGVTAELPWTVTDKAGNRADGVLGINLRAGRVPKGWQAKGTEAGEGGWVERIEDPKSGIAFRLIPSGKFQMGSSPDEARRGNDERRHWVELTKPFYMAETETTQAQWRRVMGGAPSEFDGSDLPIESVSWNEAREFCEKLGAGLPSEAEWEFACRAGASTTFSFGATLTTDDANFDGSETYAASKRGINRAQTVPVRSFEPNAYGLFDMHGNVWEWCFDGYAGYGKGSKAAPLQNPTGSPESATRVLRGGSWLSLPENLRASDRYSNDPSGKGSSIGFRVVLRL